MIAWAGRIVHPQWTEKKRSFGSTRQTSAGYRIAGYKLLSDRDLSLIRANDAPAVTKEKGTPPLFTFYKTPRFFVFWTGGASLISQSCVYWFQFKGWITPDVESKRITISSRKRCQYALRWTLGWIWIRLLLPWGADFAFVFD